MGMLEQRLSQSSDIQTDLSEDYVVLMHLKILLKSGLPIRSSNEVFGALDYIEEYGLVPESAFTLKLRSDLNNILYATALKKLGRPANGNIEALPPFSEEEAHALLEEAVGSPIPTRWTSFEFSGEKQTPLSFLRTVVGFKRADYYTIIFDNPGDDNSAFKNQMKLVQKAMLLGFTVPYGYAWLEGQTEQYGVIDCPECLTPKLAHGGHSVLLSDYKTKSSPFGSTSVASIRSGYDEPVEAFLFKNSWGAGTDLAAQDPTIPLLDGLPEYQVITRAFVEANARSTVFDRSQVGDLLDREAAFKHDDGLSQNKWFSYAIVPAKLVRDICPVRGFESCHQVEGKPSSYDLAMDWPYWTPPTPRAPVNPLVFNPNVTTKGSLLTVKSGDDVISKTQQDFAVRDGATYMVKPGLDIYACFQFEAPANVSAIAAFCQGAQHPNLVLTAEGDWRGCRKIPNGTEHSACAFQAIDKQMNAVQTRTLSFSFQPAE